MGSNEDTKATLSGKVSFAGKTLPVACRLDAEAPNYDLPVAELTLREFVNLALAIGGVKDAAENKVELPCVFAEHADQLMRDLARDPADKSPLSVNVNLKTETAQTALTFNDTRSVPDNHTAVLLEVSFVSTEEKPETDKVRGNPETNLKLVALWDGVSQPFSYPFEPFDCNASKPLDLAKDEPSSFSFGTLITAFGIAAVVASIFAAVKPEAFPRLKLLFTKLRMEWAEKNVAIVYKSLVGGAASVAGGTAVMVRLLAGSPDDTLKDELPLRQRIRLLVNEALIANRGLDADASKRRTLCGDILLALRQAAADAPKIFPEPSDPEIGFLTAVLVYFQVPIGQFREFYAACGFAVAEVALPAALADAYADDMSPHLLEVIPMFKWRLIKPAITIDDIAALAWELSTISAETRFAGVLKALRLIPGYWETELVRVLAAKADPSTLVASYRRGGASIDVDGVLGFASDADIQDGIRGRMLGALLPFANIDEITSKHARKFAGGFVYGRRLGALLAGFSESAAAAGRTVTQGEISEGIVNGYRGEKLKPLRFEALHGAGLQPGTVFKAYGADPTEIVREWSVGSNAMTLSGTLAIELPPIVTAANYTLEFVFQLDPAAPFAADTEILRWELADQTRGALCLSPSGYFSVRYANTVYPVHGELSSGARAPRYHLAVACGSGMQLIGAGSNGGWSASDMPRFSAIVPNSPIQVTGAGIPGFRLTDLRIWNRTLNLADLKSHGFAPGPEAPGLAFGLSLDCKEPRDIVTGKSLARPASSVLVDVPLFNPV